jgi:hypothetical protein
MSLKTILAELGREIENLQKARSLLIIRNAQIKRPVGRPKGTAKTEDAPKTKRNLTPEGRNQISEA